MNEAGAVNIPFIDLPSVYIRGASYRRVVFDEVQELHAPTLSQEALTVWDVDIRDILTRNAIRDIQEANDQIWASVVETVLNPTKVVEYP